jgi:hypothetical protein
MGCEDGFTPQGLQAAGAGFMFPEKRGRDWWHLQRALVYLRNSLRPRAWLRFSALRRCAERRALSIQARNDLVDEPLRSLEVIS